MLRVALRRFSPTLPLTRSSPATSKSSCPANASTRPLPLNNPKPTAVCHTCGMSWWLLLLTFGAVWRLSRLIAVDFICERLRFWGERRSPWLGYLLSCPWCISIWIAPPIAALAVLLPENLAVWIGLTALTASGAAGLMVAVEDRLDSRS